MSRPTGCLRHEEFQVETVRFPVPCIYRDAVTKRVHVQLHDVFLALRCGLYGYLGAQVFAAGTCVQKGLHASKQPLLVEFARAHSTHQGRPVAKGRHLLLLQ